MMAQSTTHACTKCSTPVPTNMRFCPNCGAPASTEAASYPPRQVAPHPPTTYPQQQQTQPVYQPASGQQGYQPPFQSSQPPPAYARPQKKSAGGVLKVGVILLLLLLLLGAGGYFAFRYVTGRGGNTATAGVNSQVTPTQAPLKTTPINATVNYASVNITIINAQQATSFADDTGTPAQGVVRLNLHTVKSDMNNA